MACVFCGVEGALDRMSGFDVCSPCRLGAVDAGLERWNLTASSREWTTRTGGDNPKTVHHLEVRVDLATPPDARAHSRQEDSMDRLRQWFSRTEPQGGDPLFDRAVFVEEAGGDELEALLRDEGVQNAVLELVAGGGVRLGDGWVRARRSGIVDIPAYADLVVPLALLGIHLETWVQLHRQR